MAKKKRMEAHEEAFRRMNNEIDLLNIMTLLRQSNFLAKLQLEEHQRELIPCFELYNVNPEAECQTELNSNVDGPYYQLGRLEDLGGFDPTNDSTDRLIWDKIAGRRLHSALQEIGRQSNRGARSAISIFNEDYDEEDVVAPRRLGVSRNRRANHLLRYESTEA
eukprot:CAMPEP_0185574548 /NCGR_PEP_ID=MMETSP0434-20130131/5995_1 /TAXON_ID=626734 ORGANISM="Favella taraikaensis, Strain Fe Narragansett Bay" /NCGR_SAMPLE_ID=MMETSP0434 /ASSEMBLY_ACC=CAM_ASM_000379 /LENGTH=163 /DNA_ID=CAMNT_0028191169 /DNA_START=1159 /DNA_END=1647 /DNA_ORIENTATION=+